MNNKRFHVPGRLLLLAFLVLVLILIMRYPYTVRDFIRLRGYTPPDAVVRLADDTAMTDHGRKLFYVNRPMVADRSAFNHYCSSRGEQTIVLGCYHGADRGIYLFDVADVRLQGVEQVTAAHEMLHAGYERLSSGERNRINSLLQRFYETDVQDQRLRDTVAAYERTEPKDVANEMHSIFATEINNLPTELEEYYRTYFTDRHKVVAYADQYQQEFTERREKVGQYDARLAALKTEMDTNTAALDRQEAEIVRLRTEMDAFRAADDIDRYNAAVPDFNARVERYNRLIETTRRQIEQYNVLVAERNNLALEVKSLAQSIDSRLTPIEQ